MEKNSSPIAKALYVFAVIFFIVSAIMFYKGYDKFTNYDNPDSAYSEHVNAYVGGDAYNYIINGTYSTGFFVLSMGFLISGIICLVSGIIINHLPISKNVETLKVSVQKDELPDL